MGYGFYLVMAVLAAVLGFAGGQLALLGDRRRRGARGQEVEGPATGAEFRLEHADGSTWSLVNVGRASASLVSVLPLTDGVDHWPPQPAPDHLSTATSELLPTLRPGDSLSVWLSRYDTGQRVMVGWTSESLVRMGPVTLSVPAPR